MASVYCPNRQSRACVFFDVATEKIIRYQPVLNLENIKEDLFSPEDVIDRFLFTKSSKGKGLQCLLTGSETYFLSDQLKSFLSQKKIIQIIDGAGNETFYKEEKRRISQDIERHIRRFAGKWWQKTGKKMFLYVLDNENQGNEEMLADLIGSAIARFNNGPKYPHLE